MKKYILPLLIVAIVVFGFTIQKTTFAKSVISFQTKNLGIGVNGTIGGLQADVQFKPNDLTGSSIIATVTTNTINTDNAGRDEHLKNEDFFDVVKYPKITLKSVSFKHKSGNTYIGHFDLTIKAKTKQVDIPFTYIEKDNAIAFKGSFKINRLDYGIGGTSLVLADEVTISIDAEAGK